jgi:hypothetical protein
MEKMAEDFWFSVVDDDLSGLVFKNFSFNMVVITGLCEMMFK